MTTIKQFLSSCPQSPPLSDFLQSCSGQAPETPLPLSQASTEGSSTHVAQAASDEDDENRYIVVIVSVQSILLTPRLICTY